MTPKVVAVSTSLEHGFSKQPQTLIHLVEGEGVEGDAHRGVTTQHLYRMRQDPTQPNLCQVHLLNAEKLEDLAARGYSVRPGELGENLLVQGIDLLALPLDTVLHVGANVALRVTGLRTPCAKIDSFQQGLQQHLWGERDAKGRKARRAGVMSVVLCGGTVKPEDEIRVELPEPPYKALPPV